MSGSEFSEPVFCYVDGSYSGGVAGIGYELQLPDGTIVSQHKESVENCDSSTHAELHALIAALREARRQANIDRVFLFSDSKSVTQLLEKSSIAAPNSDSIRKLVRKAMRLLETFETSVIAHIDRELNKSADLLAKNARTHADTQT